MLFYLGHLPDPRSLARGSASVRCAAAYFVCHVYTMYILCMIYIYIYIQTTTNNNNNDDDNDNHKPYHINIL